MRSLFFTLLFLFSIPAEAAAPGQFSLFIQGMNSPTLPLKRDIYVYLPPQYLKSKEKYPVLYMHDGQNLFDPSRAYLGQTWHAQETLNALISTGKMRPIIVVGIDNTPDRLAEYTPSHKANLYLDLIVNDLKKKIDSNFRTLTDRNHTALMGSSLGGLVSLFSSAYFFNTFGLIGAMSPSIWWDGKSILQTLETSKLPSKLYLDSGTEGGEAPENVKLVNDLMLKRGMRSGFNLMFLVQQGASHNEAAWASRFPTALRFLFY